LSTIELDTSTFGFSNTIGVAMNENEYAGFWIRALAAIIDSVLVMIIVVPVFMFLFDKDYWHGGDPGNSTLGVVISYVLPAIAVIVFWIYKSATPGKIVTNLTIVDAETGGKPSTGQFVGRYLGYYVSTLPLFLGIIWVAFDKRKQGWHDKLAGTVVVRNKPSKPENSDS
jgi:uncharacterized RDD family membrane protein YckC